MNDLAITFIKFILLSCWVVFIASATYNFTQLSTLEKSDLTDKCQKYAQEHRKLNPALLTNTYITHLIGVRTEVLLTSTATSPNYSMFLCNFDRRGELLWAQ